MTVPWFQLLDPVTRRPLKFFAAEGQPGFGYWMDENGSQRWPVALGIPFLRADRHELVQAATLLIDTNKYVEALGLLLQDIDDFAPNAPDLYDCHGLAQRLLIDDCDLSGREMMETLRYGPVADYFALRSSTPTFFSGLGLLKVGASRGRPVIDVGCGAGHFTYWLQTRGIEVLATDSVFSKLCLAHRFMGIRADRLICAVAGKQTFLPLVTSRSTSVFCHDAFYFIKDKAHSLGDFRRLAGTCGSVLIGHAHLSTADHAKVSGYPLTLDDYRRLAATNAYIFDDAALIGVGAGTDALSQAIPESAEAISIVEGLLFEDESTEWHTTNELLHAPMGVRWSSTIRQTHMQWPSEAFAEEYRAAHYLESPINPFELLPTHHNNFPENLHPGVAIPAPYFALGVKPLRWGIIGGGWIATDYFIPAFQWAPHARLVGLAEVNNDRRALHTSLTGLKTFANWREMIKECKLDAVYIATPNDLHAEMIEGVAAAGIRVLCEKPIATCLQDLQRIRECALQQPNYFQTAYDQRYHPAHLKLARRIAEGALGTVTQIRVHYACWVDGNWNKVAATDNWRINSARAGGGAGFDLLPHGLDLIEMLVNDSIEEAQLLYQGRVHDYATTKQVDDGALMSVRTTTGILASLHVGYNCPEDQPRRRIEVLGTHGRVDAYNTMGQDPGGKLVWYTSAGEEQEIFPEGAEAGPFARQLDAVTRLWLGGDAPQYPFLRDLVLAERLIHSDARARSTFGPPQLSL